MFNLDVIDRAKLPLNVSIGNRLINVSKRYIN